MKFLSITASVLVASALSGCSGGDEAAQVGTMRMALSATTASNVTYRLRDAVFDIAGPQNLSVSSESYNPKDQFITFDLHAGDYDVELTTGWFMEYSTDKKAWFVVDAALTSDNPADVAIVTDTSANVIYKFQVDGSLITFGDGKLNIGMEVEELTSRCASDLEEVDAADDPMCGGGSMGGDPITDAYVCRADGSYPANGCAAGTQMNNTWGYSTGPSAPSVACYVSQSIGATSAPTGCPIDTADITCPEGFAWDGSTTSLTWVGGGSSWGCFYKCGMTPNPYTANPNYPCLAESYAPIGGGGGDRCCATW